MYGRARAQAAGRVDELPLAQRQRLAADDAADVGPVEEADDEDEHARCAACCPSARRRSSGMTPASAIANSSSGKARKTSIEPADHRVDPAAEEAGDHAEDRADDHRRAGSRGSAISSEIRAP